MSPRYRVTLSEQERIAFGSAVAVLNDDLAITLEDNDQEEPRFITIGMSAEFILLVIVYCYPDETTIRLISVWSHDRNCADHQEKIKRIGAHEGLKQGYRRQFGKLREISVFPLTKLIMDVPEISQNLAFKIVS